MKPIPAQLSDTWQAINTLLKIYEGYEHMPPPIFKLYQRYQSELIHLQNEPMKKEYTKDKNMQYPASILPHGFVKETQKQARAGLAEDIVRLRDQGYTYPQINQQLDTGLADSGVRKVYERVKKKRGKQGQKATDMTG